MTSSNISTVRRTPTIHKRKNMARKSQRLSAGATTALPSHKRTASNTSLPGGDAKKTKTQKATPTKSQYFSKGKQTDAVSESEDDEDASVPDEDEDDDLPSAAEEDLSEFGSAPESDDAEDDEDDDEEYESEVKQPKLRRKSASAKTTTASSKKKSGGELWREGVKTGLGPGQEVIIKKPKARPAGKVPYSDETIHPNTLLFLKDLKENNNREWLKSEFDCFPFSFYTQLSFLGMNKMPYRHLPALVLSLQQSWGLVGRAVYLIPYGILTRCCSLFIMLHTSAGSLTLQQADAE